MLYIKSAYELEKNITSLYNSKFISLDSETESLDPYKGELVLLQLSNGSNTQVLNVKSIGKEAVAHYTKPIIENKDVVKILHNAKFDTKWIKHHLKLDLERIYDTYLASVILECGIQQEEGFHGLGANLERYCNVKLNKSLQKSDWSGELSQAQIEYAAADVDKLFDLREAQLKYLQKHSLIRCAKLEFEAVLPVAWLELCGFYLDFDEWLSFAKDKKTQADEIANEICNELAHLLPQTSLFGELPINLGSHTQLKKYFTQYGVPMPASTKAEFLKPLAKDYPIIQKLLKWKGLEKGWDAFGPNFEKHINPKTGRVHADFKQIGAPTGRFACNNPNLNQIPKEDGYRTCFKAQNSENTLISADFSQEELRLLADFSRDPNFLAVFARGDDFHKQAASLIFGIPFDKVTAEERSFAKNLNFGVVYGIGAKKFARDSGIPEIEAMSIINNYFKTFSKVKNYLNFKQQRVLVDRHGRTGSGRVARYEFDENDWKSRTDIQRQAANLPLQGTGADILKRSLRVFYDNSKQYHDKIKLVNVVHDQMDVEAPKSIANDIQKILVDSMVSAGSEFVTQVEIKVDAHQNEFWKKG